MFFDHAGIVYPSPFRFCGEVIFACARLPSRMRNGHRQLEGIVTTMATRKTRQPPPTRLSTMRLATLLPLVIPPALVMGESHHTSLSSSPRGECISVDQNQTKFVCVADAVSSSVCEDNEERCPQWAQVGECKKNPNYMLVNCAKSCDSCVDLHVGGVHQIAPTDADSVISRLMQTQLYVQSRVYESARFLESCVNKHELCTYNAVQGHCLSNRAYMEQTCAAACRVCR